MVHKNVYLLGFKNGELDLSIVQLHPYGCEIPSLKLLNSYLQNRPQRGKINNFYSSWVDLLFGVPQGFALGPILYISFLCDLFSLLKIKT